MSDTAFDDLQRALDRQGPEGVLARLSEQLIAEKKFHELFDVRLMQARRRTGLPTVVNTPLDDLPEPQRSNMETAYLEACREVGHRLLEAGSVREAWMYLRPVGDKQQVADALARLPHDDDYEPIIEIAVHEGVCPRLGFELVLEHYGTCNAISMFEAEMYNRSRSERQEVATLLVRHLHAELSANVRADITRQQGSAPQESSLDALVAERDWLFENDNYHVDTSHLNAVTRFALILDDRENLRMALDLTRYGRRLSRQFQPRGEEPFEDFFTHTGLFFAAILGERMDEAVEHFRQRAESLDIHDVGTGPIEVYIGLLARLGRFGEAMDESARLLPPGTRGGGFAPGLLELATLGREHARLRNVCRQRGDLVGFAAGLVDDATNGPA